MNDLGRYLRAIYRHPDMTQRELARRMRLSVGKVNAIARQAAENSYITCGPRTVTDSGLAYLEPFRVKNAIIFAAGIDVRFVPFTHETPKALMELEGERMVERVIRQLKARGITDITVVVGYLAEKFDYLIDEFGVELVFNPDYALGSTLPGLYHVRERLGNTYLVNADQWIWQNIFHAYEPDCWCACHWHEGPTKHRCAETNGKRRITKIRRGGRDKLTMLGPVYLDRTVSARIQQFLEQAYNHPEVEVEDWEEVLETQLRELEIYANILPQGLIQEFRNFDEFRDFDVSYAEVSGHGALRHIAEVFEVPESIITDMRWLDVGMTNQSFVFRIGEERYIYRTPGEGTENFISRRQEAAVYKAIRDLNISDEVLFLDPQTGIKITRYYPNSHNVAEDDWENIAACMPILRELHTSGVSVRYRFDIEERLRSYETMCRGVDCIHFADFEKTRERLKLPLSIIAETGQPLVLCHIDSVTNNFLVLEDGSLRLLDWEYGGMCHALADVAMFGVFSVYGPERLDQLLEWYFGRPATREERLLCYSYAAAAGVLWSLWAEYRQYYGEDFGEYAMTNYRLGKNYAKLVSQIVSEPDAAPAAPVDPMRQAAIVRRKSRSEEIPFSDIVPTIDEEDLPVRPGSIE